LVVSECFRGHLADEWLGKLELEEHVLR
jgi:hypothetical protein